MKLRIFSLILASLLFVGIGHSQNSSTTDTPKEATSKVATSPLGISEVQPPAIVQESEQAAKTVATDTNLIGTVELRKLDFRTTQSTNDSVAWLLSVAFAIAFGYIPAVQKWASNVKNLKGLRIAMAITPVIVIGLLFGFNGDWFKFLTDALFGVLTAGGSVGMLINPLIVKPLESNYIIKT